MYMLMFSFIQYKAYFLLIFSVKAKNVKIWITGEDEYLILLAMGS